MQSDFILIKQLTMQLSDQKVLCGVDLSIKAGQTISLVGANGTGKTTLIQILAGILSPKYGEIYINQHRYQNPAEAIKIKQMLGYAPDTPPLYANDTVHAYLEFIAQLRQIPATQIKQRIDEYIELFDLNSSRKQKIFRLSKGLQQRVNLAQAMLHKPKLLLLDEPTTALDEVHIKNLVNHLDLLQKQMTTIIIATHNYTDLLPLCDYMLKIQNGKLEKIFLPDKSTTTVWQNDQTHIPA